MSLKHERTINEVLEHVFKTMEEPWMNENDKVEIRKLVMAEMASLGVTMEVFDAQIEEGVRNGYTSEQQLSAIREFFI